MTRALSLVLLALVALVGCASVGPQPDDAGATSDAAREASAADARPASRVGQWRMVHDTMVPRTTYTLAFTSETAGRASVRVEDCSGEATIAAERFDLAPTGAPDEFTVNTASCGSAPSACAFDPPPVGSCVRLVLVPFVNGAVHSITNDGSTMTVHAPDGAVYRFTR